jgi:hypothetical protein
VVVFISLLGVGIVAVVASETLFRPRDEPPLAIEPGFEPGQGRVVSVDRQRTSDARTWLELTVRVGRRELPSYLAVAEIEVERDRRVVPGDRVALEVDPENPVRVRISSLPPPT